ncbi:MAG: hypothetical protein LC655_06530, partial [Bacteroidales bacterium]|nr:hypothetical protein [Bacteroidales bacterium]
SASKSLKSFITTGSFLGTSMVPWGDTMLNFLETTENNFFRHTISDDDEEESVSSDADAYKGVLRLLRLHRASKEVLPLSLIDRIDLCDTLCAGDEELLTDLLSLLEIDPEEAYVEIEQQLLKRLKDR